MVYNYIFYNFKFHRPYQNLLMLGETYSLPEAPKLVMCYERLQPNVALRPMKKETQSLIISILMSRMKGNIP